MAYGPRWRAEAQAPPPQPDSTFFMTSTAPLLPQLHAGSTIPAPPFQDAGVGGTEGPYGVLAVLPTQGPFSREPGQWHPPPPDQPAAYTWDASAVGWHCWV